MADFVGTAPKGTAFLDRNGRVTETWVSWFAGLTQVGAAVQQLVALTVNSIDASSSGDASGSQSALIDALTLLMDVGRAPAAAADDYALSPNVQAAAVLADLLPALDAPVNAWRAELDDLRALVVAGDPAPFGGLGSAAFVSAGVSGTIIIPKLTTTNGSITVQDGIITAFVNPT